MNYDYSSDSKRAGDSLRRRREAERKKKERRKKLIIRRTLIIAVGVLILFLLIFIPIRIGVAISSCSGGNGGGANTAQTESVDPSAATEVTQQAPGTLDFIQPEIPDPDKKATGHYSSVNSGVYIFNNTAFELFGGSDATAQDYADAISEFKKKAPELTVYNMIIPNHTEFGLPRRLIEDGTVTTNSQADNIKAIYTSYSADVKPINCYNKLSEHVNEYIYFNTDHHWTGLGAYYAYTAFAEQSGQKTLSLDVCTEKVIDVFEGSLIDNDPSLSSNKDSVHFWTFPYTTHAMRMDNMGEEPYQTTVYYEEESSGPYAYGVFIWGDAPLFIEYNDSLDNGKKIAVVKESYGNAFAPYLTANYQEVHVIDMRYYDGNLKSYCQDNGIDEVIFVNNVMAANAAVQVDRLRTLF